jgi:large subunit ribosomal protein L16
MLRIPKRSKFRKRFKGVRKGQDRMKNGEVTPLTHGEYGLRARELGRISARQLEAARRTRRHHRNRTGQVRRKVFPDVPVTKKPREIRMGKGKGNVEYWATTVRPGTRRFEVRNVEEELARKALECAGKKLPIRTNRVVRNHPERK